MNINKHFLFSVCFIWFCLLKKCFYVSSSVKVSFRCPDLLPFLWFASCARQVFSTAASTLLWPLAAITPCLVLRHWRSTKPHFHRRCLWLWSRTGVPGEGQLPPADAEHQTYPFWEVSSSSPSLLFCPLPPPSPLLFFSEAGSHVSELASDLLCGWGWPGTPGPPISTSHVLGL